MNKTELGTRIKEARVMCGYTQEQLSEMAEIGHTYLGEIERGKKMPSLKVLIRIIESLNVSADYLLRGEVSSGKGFIYDEMTEMLEPLTPAQRKAAADILEAYIKNL